MKQAFEGLNIVSNTALLSMLYILTPEGALLFIIYRISLFRNSSINFGKRCQDSFLLNGLSQNVVLDCTKCIDA